MDRAFVMGLVVVVLVVLLLLMLLGWRNRMRRQSSLPTPKRADGSQGSARHEAQVFYVATTAAGAPLDRIAVGGLGFRARASITVTELGVVLSIPGQMPVWIPADDLRGVEQATWTIDRVVERDGLVVLAWRLVDDRAVVDVDTYLRFDSADESQRFMAAAALLLDSSATESPQGGTEQ